MALIVPKISGTRPNFGSNASCPVVSQACTGSGYFSYHTGPKSDPSDTSW